MAKSEEIEAYLEEMSSKYGVTTAEDQLELLAIHLLSIEPTIEQNVLQGSDPISADLSEFWCGQSGDFGLDGVLHDPTTNGVILIQAAHRSKFNNEIEQKARSFFAKLSEFREVSTGKSTSNVRDKVSSLLRDSEVHKSAAQIKMVFVTDLATGPGSPGEILTHVAQNMQDELSANGLDVTCEVMGRADLNSAYEHLVNTYKFSGVQKESINLGSTDYFELSEPHKTLVVALSTNELRDLYNRKGVKNALFNSNVRMALGGKSKINSGMIETLENEPESFFYFNNGVTATCTSYVLEKNTVVFENLQVVNGAQTVSTIGNSKHAADSGKVLFRVIETQDAYKKKNVFADKITKFQNTQNPVKASDFYSNEPLQLWLKENLAERANRFRAAARFWYQHKRGYEPTNSNGQKLELEVLAKLRHSCLYDPQLTYNAPKDFWTDDKYWEAFGRLGESVSSWTEDEIAEVAWMVTTFQGLRGHAQAISKNSENSSNPERGYLSYLSIFATALTFKVVKHLQEKQQFPSFTDLVSTEANLKRCKPIELKVREIMLNAISDRSDRDESNPKFYLARDRSAFQKMHDRVIELIDAGLLRLEGASE